MGVRFLLWLGAGAVCAGVTVGMIAGAGTASAQTESDGDGGAKTSQSAKTAESQPDSSKAEKAASAADTGPRFGRNAVDAIDAVKHAVDDAVSRVVKAAGANDRATATGTTVATSARPQSGQRAAKFVNNVIAAVTHAPDRKVVVERTRTTEPVETPDPTAIPAERSVPAEKSPELRLVRNVRESLATPLRSNLTLQTPALTQPVSAASAPQPQINVPPVISAIGTAVFNLISFGESLIEGPPKALPGSGVTVQRSTLKIGDQEVPADWYFPDTYDPESATPPERIIYLQHGFLARGVFYDYTASYLAKSTNSVVVAPTLTSNIFATDGMWLGGDQMHRAAADLFNDDNTALLESARAAGYSETQPLPQNVVLIGHSLGGGFVIDTARYMLANQSEEKSTYYKLAGVVMLDGVSFTDPVPILKELDEMAPELPIYNLSATPYPWNLFGTMDAALAQVRPTDFTGAQMFFGFHSDAMVGGNPLIQLGAYLLTGYGGPANVAGTQILAAGWINDMFNGDQASGLYGEPGSTIKIPTPVGPAIGLVQPRQGVLTSLAQGVTGVFLGLLAHINFATDVPAPPTTVSPLTAQQVVAGDSTAGPTGVTVGHSDLTIPYGPHGYTTSADWYFPTQADGSVQPDGVIWLQHGFLGKKSWYSALATDLARQTNSVVVVPNVPSFPRLRCWDCTLNSAALQEATATMFLGDRSALNDSARAAGFDGTLPQQFILAGHSAGGGFATAVGGYAVENGAAAGNLRGVVMFDGVSSNGTFGPALAHLDSLDIPVYQIAAPPQPWNADGQTTNELVTLRPGEFTGVVLKDGSHVDSLIGGVPIIDFIAQLVIKKSPPGNTAAVYTLASGWIKDMYAGDRQYGLYGSGGQQIVLGPATATVLGTAPALSMAA